MHRGEEVTSLRCLMKPSVDVADVLKYSSVECNNTHTHVMFGLDKCVKDVSLFFLPFFSLPMQYTYSIIQYVRLRRSTASHTMH